jgi:hypothetical protein
MEVFCLFVIFPENYYNVILADHISIGLKFI